MKHKPKSLLSKQYTKKMKAYIKKMEEKEKYIFLLLANQ